MYKKQLYRTAFISSPIMAMFALSPTFFLWENDVLFILKVVFHFSVISLFMWIVNIYFIEIFKSNKKNENWKRYLFSYLVAILIVAIFILIIKFSTPHRRKMHSIIFPFITAMALNTIILIISNSILIRSKKILADQELAILKIKNLEAEQQQLIQQLQPHFLFNALSTLKSLISTNSDLAEEYLLKLSDFLRVTISAHTNKLILLTDELKYTKDYIRLQQLRFPDSFFYEITIPEENINEYYIPVFALQTLVENAIKHNAFTEERPLKLFIKQLDNCIMVSNNKMPKLTVSKGGVGLNNLDKRYSLICDEKIIVEETSDIFKVTIKLIQKDKAC